MELVEYSFQTAGTSFRRERPARSTSSSTRPGHLLIDINGDYKAIPIVNTLAGRRRPFDRGARLLGRRLAAIQGLYELVKEKNAEIDALKARLSKLEAKME